MADASKFGIIDRGALKDKLDRKQPLRLWNVLPKEYFRADRNIPSSVWVPPERIAETLRSLAVAKDEEIVVYCTGWRCPYSKQAAEKLAYLGYAKVWAYEGGIQDWVEGGLPLETIR